MYGTLGEILTEKSGNMNLGVEGLMFMGGASGTIASYYYEAGSTNPSAVVSVLIAMAVAFWSLCLAASFSAF
jgi:simple sugar transport system permease protein